LNSVETLLIHGLDNYNQRKHIKQIDFIEERRRKF